MKYLSYKKQPVSFIHAFCFMAVVSFSLSYCRPGNAQVATDTPTPGTAVTAKQYTYNLAKWKNKWQLPPQLIEISGNSFVDESHLLAIEDMTANLYLLKLSDAGVQVEKTIPFTAGKDSSKADIEDIAVADGVAYALWSHGSVYKIKDWNSKPVTEQITTDLTRKNNTEGICFDPVSNSLLIACKGQSGDEDEKKSGKAVYRLSIADNKLEQPPFMVIEKKDLKAVSGEKMKFFPSAIAVHPVTHDIYMLSTRDYKGMAIFTHDGVLKSLQAINRADLLQPEGLCFSPEGTLYISTEGRKDTPAYLFAFTPLP